MWSSAFLPQLNVGDVMVLLRQFDLLDAFTNACKLAEDQSPMHLKRFSLWI